MDFSEARNLLVHTMALVRDNGLEGGDEAVDRLQMGLRSAEAGMSGCGDAM
jgi:hypothetical protein